ncbi:MAG: ribonuclease VapC [Nitrospirales bacterium]|nr:MAG: ribonuclease VapC [Nitrospirales bacterium]
MGFTSGSGRVVVDTSIWISFFNRPASIEKQALDDLLDRDDVVLVGIVLTELLQGVRSKTEREVLHELFSALPYLEMTFQTWLSAGDLSSFVRQKGKTLGFPDLLIAALALQHSCSVYSLDHDFRQIPGLSLYTPPTA